LLGALSRAGVDVSDADDLRPLKVKDWLATKSFEEQATYGRKSINQNEKEEKMKDSINELESDYRKYAEAFGKAAESSDA
jgi:hypothetical protein